MGAQSLAPEGNVDMAWGCSDIQDPSRGNPCPARKQQNSTEQLDLASQDERSPSEIRNPRQREKTANRTCFTHNNCGLCT